MNRRAILMALCAFACLLAMPVYARAEAEFCPAVVPFSHSFESGSTHLVAFRLLAYSSRSLHGDIDIVSDGRWFTVPFPETVLAKDIAHIESPVNEFDRTTYLSPVIYAQVPVVLDQPTLWVTDAQTTGETVFGWDKLQTVQCTPPAGLGIPKKPDIGTTHETRRNPLPRWAPPDPSSTIVTAHEIAAPHVTCDVPSAEAHAINTVAPDYPQSLFNLNGGQLEVVVAIAINSDGGVQGLWLDTPSPYKAANQAAARAAVASTYAPGRALCQNVPGIYLFQADFTPYQPGR